MDRKCHKAWGLGAKSVTAGYLVPKSVTGARLMQKSVTVYLIIVKSVTAIDPCKKRRRGC